MASVGTAKKKKVLFSLRLSSLFWFLEVDIQSCDTVVEITEGQNFVGRVCYIPFYLTNDSTLFCSVH